MDDITLCQKNHISSGYIEAHLYNFVYTQQQKSLSTEKLHHQKYFLEHQYTVTQCLSYSCARR